MGNIQSKLESYQNSSFRSKFQETLALFSRADRNTIWIVIAVQIFLSVLDLVGIAAVGVLGALTVTGIESSKTGNRVNSFLKILHIENYNFRTQVLLVAIFATGLLVFRSIFSITLTRKILHFISRRAALISSQLIGRLFSGSILTIEKYSKQEILYSTTIGVQSLTLGIIGTSITVIADISTLLILSVGILIVEPLMALSIFMGFGIIGTILYRSIKSKAYEIGSQELEFGVASNQKIVEFLDTFREAIVKNRRIKYIQDIEVIRSNLASVQAERAFMPNISKYVMEASVLLGALIIGAIQFSIHDARHAVASLAIFMAAGTRIAPAVLRIQQGAVQIKNSTGSAASTFQLIEESSATRLVESDLRNPDFTYDGFVGDVDISHISFSYDKKTKVLDDVVTHIKSGEIIAIVGPSGAGKSTLVDLILGIFPPLKGQIRISGEAPLTAFERWPGSVAYVPQSISVIMGTVKENIALGFIPDEFEESRYWLALEQAQLKTFVEGLPNGLNTFVGDNGSRLSGGQRQRLGLARALFTKPKLLILDEATSSLDVNTENSIVNVVKNLGGQTTVITIAHRLSSVRNSDRLLYLNNGKIEAEGTFEELRKLLPDFDRQVGLMGL